MTTPKDVITTHFWSKHIIPNAQWIANESLKALANAGFIVTPGTAPSSQGPCTCPELQVVDDCPRHHPDDFRWPDFKNHLRELDGRVW